MDEKMDPKREKLFHEIALQVEKEFGCGGLTGGLYEDFAHEILVRFFGTTTVVTHGLYGIDLYEPNTTDKAD